MLGRSGASLALGPCNRLLSAKLTRFSALGPAHLGKPSRLDLLGSTHSPRPPPSLGPAALSWAQPLHSEPLRSEPSVGPFGSDPSGSNSSARFLDLVLDRSDLRARGSWPLQSSAALGIGVLRRLPVRLVQPLCPARSRLDRSTRFASLRLGLLLDSVPSDRAPQIGPLRSGPLGSNPSPAPILVIWSSAALALRATAVLAVCHFGVVHVPAEGGRWRSALSAGARCSFLHSTARLSRSVLRLAAGA